MNNKKTLGATSNSSPLKVESIINGKVAPALMGQGLDSRVRSGLYPEIHKSGRSVHNQHNSITTTERHFSMPAASGQNLFTRLTGTSGSALQISSTSALDTAASTGALTIYIEGLVASNSANTWTEVSTFSTPTTMNGQTAVQIGSRTDWYRINKIWVLTTGSGNTNAGDIYISPNGTALTAGVPDSDILQAMIVGFSVSTGGFFSVATDRTFQFIIGNFYVDESKNIVIHECFYQSFAGSGNSADMTLYEVGNYPSVTGSFDYTGAAPYTALTDISLSTFTTTGTADKCVYYVEYVPIIASNAST